MSGLSTVYTVDSISPVLRYSENWREGSSVDDKKTAGYSNSTFTVSQVFGATMDLTFNGTAILIVGAKRNNHGPYSVTLDGQLSNFNGFADPDIFQQSLFQADNLEQGIHNIKLTNMPSSGSDPFIDVDFVQWRSTSQGTSADYNKSQTIEDNDPSFSFQPAGSWSTDLAGRSGFSSSNGHIALAQDAHMTLNFSGASVQLMGSVGPDHGSYDVWLDGSNMGLFNANKTNYVAQQVLFVADNLGKGQHNLTIAAHAENGFLNKVLGIDYAVVSGVYTSGNAPARIDQAAIAGIAVGAVVALALIIAGYILWRSRHRKRYLRWRTLAERGVSIDGPSNLGLDPSTYAPNPYPYGYSEPKVDPELGSTGNVLMYQTSTSSAGRAPRTFGLPQNPRQNPMYIPGREQDFGPAPVTASLPPNYKQALETYSRPGTS